MTHELTNGKPENRDDKARFDEITGQLATHLALEDGKLVEKITDKGDNQVKLPDTPFAAPTDKPNQLTAIEKSTLLKKAHGLELTPEEQEILSGFDEDAVDAFVQLQRAMIDREEEAHSASYDPRDTEIRKVFTEETNRVDGRGTSKSRAGMWIARLDYDGSRGDRTPAPALRTTRKNNSHWREA